MSTTSTAVIGNDIAERQLVTVRIHQQLLGIPVLDVREILREQKITKIPLAPGGIAGTLNLRGRIVTVVDIRHRLELPARDTSTLCTFVMVEHKGELYSLIVDSVGDILNTSAESVQDVPPNIAANWRKVAAGVIQLEKELLIILDPKALFIFD